MRNINYKLIVSDFDGTLIDDKQRVPEKVKKAIAEYVESGGVFAVCTGRMLRSILPQVRALGLKGLVVGHQGAVIADIESGKLIRNVEISAENTAEATRTIRGLGYPVNVFNGDTILSDIPKNASYLRTYERIIGVETTFVEDIEGLILSKKLTSNKIMALVAENERDALYKILSEKLGDRFDVTCSAKVLVEVSSLGVTKGEALKYLCGHFAIPVEKSVAIGDNLNDLSMIKAAGVGVAVDNGDAKLKNSADFIAISNNDGAVAQIIEKYGFA